MMTKFRWGGMDKYTLHLDENAMRMSMNLRIQFTRLAEALAVEGKNDSALAVIDKCVEVMPHENVPYDFLMYQMADLYTQLGEFEKATPIMDKLIEVNKGNVRYYLNLDKFRLKAFEQDYQQSQAILLQISETYYRNDRTAEAHEVMAFLAGLLDDDLAKFYQPEEDILSNRDKLLQTTMEWLSHLHRITSTYNDSVLADSIREIITIANQNLIEAPTLE